MSARARFAASWIDRRTGTETTRPVANVFLMLGAIPNTDWLDGCVALDAKGFVKTGSDLTAEDLATARWPLAN